MKSFITYLKMVVRREVLVTLVVIILAIITAVLTSSSTSIKPFANSSVTKIGKGAVVANGIECSKIGADILRRNGSAVDAAIATLFCDGVTCPQSTGLGGGFFMTIYTKETGVVETLDAREVAPGAATEEMFVGNAEAAKVGGLAVAVPGELKGYFEAHRKYGKLPWKDIVNPIVELCEKGHEVSRYLEKVLRNREEAILKEPSLREVFINPQTNHTWKQGDILKRPKLAETLAKIAEEGADALYSKDGSLLQPFVQDVQNFGGIITEEDLLNYE